MTLIHHAYKQISTYKEVYTQYSDFDTSYKENHAYEEISTYKEIYTLYNDFETSYKEISAYKEVCCVWCCAVWRP